VSNATKLSPADKLPNKFVVEFDEFKTLSRKERWKILLGYNLVVRSKVIVDRKNSSVKAGNQLFLSKHNDADEAIREMVDDSQCRVCHRPKDKDPDGEYQHCTCDNQP